MLVRRFLLQGPRGALFFMIKETMCVPTVRQKNVFPRAVAALLDLEGLPLSGKTTRGDTAAYKASRASTAIGSTPCTRHLLFFFFLKYIHTHIYIYVCMYIYIYIYKTSSPLLSIQVLERES